MSRLTKYEKETIMSFNEEAKYAYVYTYNKGIIKLLDRLSENDTEITVEKSGDEYKEYKLPKKLIKIKKPRHISDEYKSKLKETAMSNFKNIKKEINNI